MDDFPRLNSPHEAAGLLMAIFESAFDGIVVIDGKGRIQAFNAAVERLFDHAASDVLGRNINMLMPQPYRDEHDAYLARYFATGVPTIIGTGREVTGLRRDGTTFPVHLSVGETSVNGKRMFAGILHDLSDRVQMEEQLRERAAFVRLGEMAAMIAHEVKNPLAGIRGAIEVIGGRLPPESQHGPVVTEIIRRIDDLNNLMTDLLVFARPPQLRLAPVDVSTLLKQTADLFAQDPGVRDVRVEIHGSAPPVLADAKLLTMVFTNLLVNGADAMAGRGVIRIVLTPSESACRIAFHDSGPGIPVDVREKVFTPFFSTKPRGSGLGLATARRFIEAHAGRIGIECPPDGGTVVTVQLPVEAAG